MWSRARTLCSERRSYAKPFFPSAGWRLTGSWSQRRAQRPEQPSHSGRRTTDLERPARGGCGSPVVFRFGCSSQRTRRAMTATQQAEYDPCTRAHGVGYPRRVPCLIPCRGCSAAHRSVHEITSRDQFTHRPLRRVDAKRTGAGGGVGLRRTDYASSDAASRALSRLPLFRLFVAPEVAFVSASLRPSHRFLATSARCSCRCRFNSSLLRSARWSTPVARRRVIHRSSSDLSKRIASERFCAASSKGGRVDRGALPFASRVARRFASTFSRNSGCAHIERCFWERVLNSTGIEMSLPSEPPKLSRSARAAAPKPFPLSSSTTSLGGFGMKDPSKALRLGIGCLNDRTGWVARRAQDGANQSAIIVVVGTVCCGEWCFLRAVTARLSPFT